MIQTQSKRLALIGFACPLLLLASGCGGNLETQARMFRHFGQAHQIQTAAVFGRVDAAKTAAGRLTSSARVSGMPSGSDAYVRGLQEAAEAVMTSESPDRLPYLAAQVADRCGDCHAAYEVGPAFGVGRVAEGRDMQGHMAVHSWASERMWEALISRDEEAWLAGANALSGRPIDPDEFVPLVGDRGAAFLLSSRAHYLAESSAELQGWEERSGLLSRLTSTCYECHSLAGLR